MRDSLKDTHSLLDLGGFIDVFGRPKCAIAHAIEDPRMADMQLKPLIKLAQGRCSYLELRY